ncbi:hypothetical protein [Xanthomonas sp. 4461]|uniref:Secreted protein n=1 Tax=Xanthomonas sp. 10-10 TaxID=3115848 RepID=A0AAU7P433_9XANT|nr:hypothetical protein [Xanthomonas sp. 4461]MCS3807340.1 hypothetical protein [Xanthomonas sp. 4461]
MPGDAAVAALEAADQPTARLSDGHGRHTESAGRNRARGFLHSAHTHLTIARSVVLALLVSGASSAQAEKSANQDDSPTDWPLGQQHLLSGHYVGKLHPDNGRCQSVRAELWLEAAKGKKDSHRYTLKTTCITRQTRGRAATLTERGPWWLDMMGDECLILSRKDVSDLSLNPNMYGFRINATHASGSRPATYELAQDGSNCHSGDWPEHRDKVLKRVR